ncbi:MAG: hypothetical protein AAGB97_06220 [Dehalococcoidia bacterium]
MAIAGGVLALTRPAVGGTLMLVNGVGGVGAAVAFVISEGFPDCPADDASTFIVSYFIALLLLIPGAALA